MSPLSVLKTTNPRRSAGFDCKGPALGPTAHTASDSKSERKQVDSIHTLNNDEFKK